MDLPRVVWRQKGKNYDWLSKSGSWSPHLKSEKKKSEYYGIPAAFLSSLFRREEEKIGFKGPSPFPPFVLTTRLSSKNKIRK